MTNETKQLFDAPWEEGYDSDTGETWITDKNGRHVADISRHGMRIACLPELYDLLMSFVVNDCPHAFISNDECRLCPDKKCKTREAVELLQKVRDGR